MDLPQLLSIGSSSFRKANWPLTHWRVKLCIVNSAFKYWNTEADLGPCKTSKMEVSQKKKQTVHRR